MVTVGITEIAKLNIWFLGKIRKGKKYPKLVRMDKVCVSERKIKLPDASLRNIKKDRVRKCRNDFENMVTKRFRRTRRTIYSGEVGKTQS